MSKATKKVVKKRSKKSIGGPCKTSGLKSAAACDLREDPIVWIPGTPPPDQIHQYIDKAVIAMCREYDDTRKADLQRNYIVKHPHNAQDAFFGMMDQIALLSPPDQDRAIAAFMDEVIKVRVWRLDQSQKQEKSAQVNVAKAEEQFYNMQKIQRGDFAIVTPVNYNQNGASVVSNDLVNKTDSGKAKD